MPSISICIPTYNRCQDLAHGLGSILSQTRGDFEVLVLDDNSSDRTGEVVRSFGDPRVRYVVNDSNIGIYGNFNRCLELAHGDYVAIYHDHDVYRGDIVEKSAALLDAHLELSFVHCALAMMDSQGNLTGMDVRDYPQVSAGSDVVHALLAHLSSNVMSATVMMRRVAYEQVGRFDTSYGNGADKMMWYRLCTFGDVGYIAEPMALIRERRPGSATAQMDWQQVRLDWHLHMDLVQAAYSGRDMAIAEGQKALSQQFGRVMVSLLARAFVLESDGFLSDGIQLAHDLNLHRLAFLAGVLRHSPVVRCIAEKLLLPLHYARLEKSRLRARAHTISYCASHPEFARDVERLSYATDIL